jgi:hypothetical protein
LGADLQAGAPTPRAASVNRGRNATGDETLKPTQKSTFRKRNEAAFERELARISAKKMKAKKTKQTNRRIK